MLLQTKLKLYGSLKTQPLLMSKTITEQKQNNLHCDRCVLSVKPEYSDYDEYTHTYHLEQ